MLQGKGFIFSDKAASIYVGIGLAHQDMIVRQKSEGHPFLEYKKYLAQVVRIYNGASIKTALPIKY